jgi:Zn ribbon nucleic-acid-binding protein
MTLLPIFDWFCCICGQHDYLWARNNYHLRLRCVECGHETVGIHFPKPEGK